MRPTSTVTNSHGPRLMTSPALVGSTSRGPRGTAPGLRLRIPDLWATPSHLVHPDRVDIAHRCPPSQDRVAAKDRRVGRRPRPPCRHNRGINCSNGPGNSRPGPNFVVVLKGTGTRSELHALGDGPHRRCGLQLERTQPVATRDSTTTPACRSAASASAAASRRRRDCGGRTVIDQAGPDRGVGAGQQPQPSVSQPTRGLMARLPRSPTKHVITISRCVLSPRRGYVPVALHFVRRAIPNGRLMPRCAHPSGTEVMQLLVADVRSADE